jgi:hypothetical protein
MRLAAVALSMGLVTSMAHAQQPATQPTTKAPAAQTPPPAAKTTTKSKATDSPCKGLAEAACTTNPACSFVKEVVRKDGKKQSAYCRKKPTSKAATKGAPATPAAPAAPAAPAKKS